jgi:transcription initiation factor TFIID subunit 2
MTGNFKLNKKRNQIEFAMRINNKQLRARNKQDTITIRVHETEVTYDRAVKVEHDEFIVDEFAHQSRWKRSKREKEAEREGQHEVIAEMIQLNDTPLLWMRIDPEMLWIRKVQLQQADYMWVFQLYQDRDVVAQVEAIQGLCSPMLNPTLTDGTPPLVTEQMRALCCRVLKDTLGNAQVFHRVRGRAAHVLGRLCLLRIVEDEYGSVQEVREWVGAPVLLACARGLFLDEETELPEANRFSDLDGYLVRLGVVDALAACRQNASLSPGGAAATAQVYQLLHTLCEYNDNSQNGMFSDGEYVAALLLAMARACSSDVEEVEKARMLVERYLQVHTSAYVSIRQHTSAYVSIRQRMLVERYLQVRANSSCPRMRIANSSIELYRGSIEAL